LVTEPRAAIIVRAAAGSNLLPVHAQLDLIEREAEMSRACTHCRCRGMPPGHMGLVITSRGEQALHIADVVLDPIHLGHPDWYPLFYIDPDQAGDTRRRLVDRAAAEQCMVIAYHFRFRSTGGIVQTATGWAWEPVQE
jgi:hypothetical protein